jgi:hypothetical protein
MMVWGAGTATCAEFVKVTEQSPVNEVAFGQWLHGYLTGRNHADSSVTDHAAGIDRVALLAWITKYCKEHPLDTFFVASDALIRELQSTGRMQRR